MKKKDENKNINEKYEQKKRKGKSKKGREWTINEKLRGQEGSGRDGRMERGVEKERERKRENS